MHNFRVSGLGYSRYPPVSVIVSCDCLIASLFSFLFFFSILGSKGSKSPLPNFRMHLTITPEKHKQKTMINKETKKIQTKTKVIGY